MALWFQSNWDPGIGECLIIKSYNGRVRNSDECILTAFKVGGYHDISVDTDNKYNSKHVSTV